MLLRITGYDGLDERKLMDIYSESNTDNTEYFFPGEADRDLAVRKVEAGFLGFLKEGFFKTLGAFYWVLEEEGVWLSALRTCSVRQGVIYLEALETRPDRRGRGYGSRLLAEVLGALKEEGPFRLCDCVGKRNAASLRTHEKCGFEIVSEEGYDYLRGEADPRDYGLEYRYTGG